MYKIRPAKREDSGLIMEFIKGIADYEKLSNEVTSNPVLLEEWLFDKKVGEVAFVLDETMKEVGFVLYFHNFSTFVGKAGMYIEDLFVYPEYRNRGFGKALFNFVVDKAKKEGLGRVEWTCLDWNTPSIEFYKSLGAVPMNEWTNFRLKLN